MLWFTTLEAFILCQKLQKMHNVLIANSQLLHVWGKSYKMHLNVANLKTQKKNYNPKIDFIWSKSSLKFDWIVFAAIKHFWISCVLEL